MKRVVVVVLAITILLMGCASDMKLTKERGTVSSAVSNKQLEIDKDISQSKTMEDIGFIFKYGVGAKNVINTFSGSITKDLISDGTITIPLELSQEELSNVYDQLKAMDVMNYPDTFDEGYSIPHLTYDLTIRINGKTKKIIWDDGGLAKSKEAQKLKDLVNSTRKIVENKEEYKKLPPATGFYD